MPSVLEMQERKIFYDSRGKCITGISFYTLDNL